MIRPLIKRSLLRWRPAEYVYSRAQEAWFEKGLHDRRERYHEAVRLEPEAYQPEAHVHRARRRISARGYSVVPKAEGDVHTYAYIPSNWSHQNQIAAALAPLGPVTRFDYVSRNITLEGLRSCGHTNADLRQQLFRELLRDLRSAHRDRPIDWFFSYATGFDMSTEVARRIHEEIGVPTVNISLDDKNWWDVIERRTPFSGMKNFVCDFDLGWTSASAVPPWYWAEGGQAIFLPEGVDTDWFAPVDVAQDISVGFVGNAFGHRPHIIEALRRAGIEVQVHGLNWPFKTRALTDNEMRRFFSRCRINLGLGDMHYSRWMTNLKGRDFEAPSTGRALYLTTYNVDLASCFHVGHEIQCYRGLDEMIELIRRYLRDDDGIRETARRGRLRCLAEHQWIHRYRHILRVLGILT